MASSKTSARGIYTPFSPHRYATETYRISGRRKAGLVITLRSAILPQYARKPGASSAPSPPGSCVFGFSQFKLDIHGRTVPHHSEGVPPHRSTVQPTHLGGHSRRSLQSPRDTVPAPPPQGHISHRANLCHGLGRSHRRSNYVQKK
ncbi:hypothetical protein AVEN_39761-1 [Araneus ventricosus]|uniref:Uncharacterized protein n=1 Tax=Araneus ventricosus TaxID=182803 RepID=A0A4Y2I5I0_ARAVE|nr:hypothetical protein AVEN_39761-1 [Araneus ventricosus]